MQQIPVSPLASQPNSTPSPLACEPDTSLSGPVSTHVTLTKGDADRVWRLPSRKDLWIGGKDLWIGGMVSATDPELYEKHGVTSVVTLITTTHNPPSGIPEMVCPLAETPGQILAGVVARAVMFILQHPGSVLIRCGGGINRSASVAIGVILQMTSLAGQGQTCSYDYILHNIKKHRSCVGPMSSFERELRLFDRSLNCGLAPLYNPKIQADFMAGQYDLDLYIGNIPTDPDELAVRRITRVAIVGPNTEELPVGKGDKGSITHFPVDEPATSTTLVGIVQQIVQFVHEARSGGHVSLVCVDPMSDTAVVAMTAYFTSILGRVNYAQSKVARYFPRVETDKAVEYQQMISRVFPEANLKEIEANLQAMRKSIESKVVIFE